jgi:hypothetical protein
LFVLAGLSIKAGEVDDDMGGRNSTAAAGLAPMRPAALAAAAPAAPMAT